MHQRCTTCKQPIGPQRQRLHATERADEDHGKPMATLMLVNSDGYWTRHTFLRVVRTNRARAVVQYLCRETREVRTCGDWGWQSASSEGVQREFEELYGQLEPHPIDDGMHPGLPEGAVIAYYPRGAYVAERSAA